MKKLVLFPALVLTALALASCGGGGDSTSSEAESAPTETEAGGKLERSPKVEIVNFAYGPDPVRVQAGGKVIWQNMDAAPHTATADDGSFDTGTLEQGKLKSETFKEPGTYTYYCEIHPTMHGTVEVVEKD
jgi:plastocyanin